MLLDILASFGVAFLAGLGVGGGGLFLVYLVSFCGISASDAVGVNLLFYIFALGGAAITHFKKNQFDIKQFAVMAACGIPGAVIGSCIYMKIDTSFIKNAFGILLALTGVFSLFKKEK